MIFISMRTLAMTGMAEMLMAVPRNRAKTRRLSGEARNVDGSGTFNSTAGTATFSIDVTGNGHGIPTGTLTYSDPNANVTFTRVRLRRLAINGNTATVTGLAMLDNGSGKVAFTVTAVDNSADGSSDTFSITLDNGYSESGPLTSGNITIQ